MLNHYSPILCIHDLNDNTGGKYILYWMINLQELLLPNQGNVYLIVDDTLEGFCEHIHFTIFSLNIAYGVLFWINQA